jgi:hypothetical protein
MYKVVIDGISHEFTGSNAYIDAMRTASKFDKGKNGISQHHVQFFNSDNILRFETFKGQKV